jgi:hypothetical protein
MYFGLTSDGKSTAAALQGLLKKVRSYEDSLARRGTLDTQLSFEMFASWLCMQQGQAQSLPNTLFAIKQLADGVSREWLGSKSLKVFVKRLTKLYGRKPETGLEWTVDMVHKALAMLDAEAKGDKWRSKALILLLFLAAWRIGEVSGDLRGLKAPSILIGSECIIMQKEDSKTKSHYSTTFVTSRTRSGLDLKDVLLQLLREMRVPLRPVTITLRGQLTLMEQPNYFTADLWFADWKVDMNAAMLSNDVLEGRQGLTMFQRLRGMLLESRQEELRIRCETMMKVAETRAGVKRNSQDRFMVVWGSTEEKVQAFVQWAADFWGLKLVKADGALIRTTVAESGGSRSWGHSALSTGQAGKTVATMMRSVAAESYLNSGILNCAARAKARAASEKWVSHGGRRGFTTEVLALLGKYRAEHPGEVADDSEHLVNIHADWVSDEATTQEHYTGMRPLEQLLLLTWLC